MTASTLLHIMPKSRRVRRVALTQTESKGREGKQRLINNIRESVDGYKYTYVLRYHNLRSNHFKALRTSREGLRGSRLFLGKNKVMRIALGKTEDTAYVEQLHTLGKDLSGNVALCCSNLSPDDLRARLEVFVVADYARGGDVAPRGFTLSAGKLTGMQHTMVDELRTLGLKEVTLVNGAVTLHKDYVVCKAGQVLSPERARILKLFKEKMSEFRISVHSHWTNGEYTSVTEGSEELTMAVDDEVETKKKAKGKVKGRKKSVGVATRKSPRRKA